MSRYKHNAWDMDIIINAVYDDWNGTENDAAILLRRLVDIREEKHRKYKFTLSDTEHFIVLNALIKWRNDIIDANDEIALKDANALLVKYAS